MKGIGADKKGIVTEKRIRDGIAKIFANEWPNIPNQKEMAEALKTTQSRISLIMSDGKKMKDVPLTISYQGENMEFVDKIRKEYKMENVTVFPFAKYFTQKKAYFKQLGSYAADIIIDKINEIIKIKSGDNKYPIKITTSCGRSVSESIMCVVNELKQTDDINLEISGCNAIRSESLVGLSPLHIEAQLLSVNPNINVTNAYQLPRLSAEPGSSFAKKKGRLDRLEEIVDQRIKTHPRFGFDENLLDSDIVLLGLGTVHYQNTPAVGFAKHIENEKLKPLMEALGIQGEVGYAPFNKKGFLFHGLMEHAFRYNVKEREFKNFNEEFIVKGLKKCAENPEKINKEHIIQAINLFSSIFTLNFCRLNEFNKENKKPYILLLVGGDVHKAPPLMTLLELWKENNILDGLVIGENIAEEVVKNIE